MGVKNLWFDDSEDCWCVVFIFFPTTGLAFEAFIYHEKDQLWITEVWQKTSHGINAVRTNMHMHVPAYDRIIHKSRPVKCYTR